MNSPSPDLSSWGPAEQASWEIISAGTGTGRPISLLITPDSNNSVRGSVGLPLIFHYLPQVPRLAIDRGNRPIFSLTLLLEREPLPDEEDILHLVERGELALTFTLNIPDSILEALAEDRQAEFQPLFTRQAVFSFLKEGATQGVLSEQVSGTSPWSAMNVHLGREEALRVLSAVSGIASGLSIGSQITYRTAPSPERTLTLRGNWGQVHHFLQERFGPGGEITQEPLRTAFEEMIHSGILEMNEIPGDNEGELINNISALFRSFLRLASLLMHRQTLDLDLGDAANRYILRDTAPSGMSLDLKHTIMATSGREEFKELSSTLEEVLDGAFAGQDLEAFIHLVYPGSGGGFDPLPRRVKSTRPRTVAGPRSPRLATFQIASRAAPRVEGRAQPGAAVGALALALQPNLQTRPIAHALLASDAVYTLSPVQTGPTHWAVDDMVLVNAGGWFGNHQPAVRNLPVVEDRSAPLWPDRLDANRFWYPPTFEPVIPALNAGPSTSPFMFSFTASGHDLTGQVGLDGVVRFTLKQAMSAATQAALQARGNPPAAPVSLTDISVYVQIPFRDQTGATRRELLPAEVEQNGSMLTVTLRVIDNWVRLLYGALAFPGFQTEPAYLQVSYTYEAYVPVDFKRLQPYFGGKSAEIPLVKKEEDLSGIREQIYLDTRDGAIHLPSGLLRLAREVADMRVAPPQNTGESASSRFPPESGGEDQQRIKTGRLDLPLDDRSLGPTISAASTEANAEAGATAVAERREVDPKDTPLRPLPLAAAISPTTVAALPIATHHTLIVHPELHVPPIVDVIEVEKQYALQTLGVTLQAEVVYPCETFGVLYLQETDQGQQTVACMDVLKLGQTEYKQYRLLTDADLRSPFYTLYRSLQMPERFLVLPIAYRITRFGPDEGDKAYRPAIFLFSTIDAENLANSRCEVMATLQPDLPLYARRDLTEKLAKLTNRVPLIEYITGIESQVQYRWSLPSGQAHPVEAQVAKLWDSFQVGMATDVDGVLQLRALLESGAIAAEVEFRLPDGTVLHTGLKLDLREITGPWEGGPVEIRIQGDSLTLTNKIERGLNISDLHIYLPDQPMQAVQLDRSLAKGESWSGPTLVGATEIYPVYTLQSAGPVELPEIRSFIEDIHLNIIFLCQASFDNHQLKKLEIQARIKDQPGTYDVSLPGEQTPASLDVLLPLTSFLSNPVLQFQVIKTDTADQVSRTPWLDWPLATKGTVVSLTWELIANSQS